MNSIWIVGNGRSGTHFLCKTFLDYENIIDFLNGTEDKNLLINIRQSAIQGNKLSEDILKEYKNKIHYCEKLNKIFLDQHHPNLWHVEQLLTNFNNSKFIFIDRKIEQTVASMTKHNSIKNNTLIIKKGEKNIILPNSFYGIENSQELNLDIIMLFCKRVQSHKLFAKK